MSADLGAELDATVERRLAPLEQRVAAVEARGTIDPDLLGVQLGEVIVAHIALMQARTAAQDAKIAGLETQISAYQQIIKAYESRLDGFGDALPALRGRIADVEQRAATPAPASSGADDPKAPPAAGTRFTGYRGVHNPQTVYSEGETVTASGSLWLATRDLPSGRPGEGETSGWKLIVKCGKPADEKRLAEVERRLGEIEGRAR